MEEIKQEVRRLIGRAKVEQAFEKLLALPKEQLGSAESELFQLQGRWTQVTQEERQFLISSEQAGLERNRITHALLTLIDQLGKIVEIINEDPPGTQQTRILFLAANPTQTGQLRLGAEHREIKERLRGTTHRDKFDLEERFAARPRDLNEAMAQYAPNIVHFSGHGLLFKEGAEAVAEGDTRLIEFGDPEADLATKFRGGIVLETSSGSIKVVSANALGGLFELHAGEVQCVFLNACYSEAQADAIIPHVPFIVGMNTAVPDETAIVFAEAFYSALGEREDIRYAFKSARNRLQLEDLPGQNIPVLRDREEEQQA